MYIKRIGDYNPTIPYYAISYFYNYPSFTYIYSNLLDRVYHSSQSVNSFLLYSITDNVGTFIYDRIHWLPTLSALAPVSSKIEYRILFPILTYSKVCEQDTPQQGEQQDWPPFMFDYNFALCLVTSLYNFYTCIVYNQNCICGATQTKFNLSVDLDPCNKNLRLEITKNTIFEYKYRIFIICNNNLIYSNTINYTDSDIIHDIDISALSSYFNCNVKLKVFIYYLDTASGNDILVDAFERELDYLHTIDITIKTRHSTIIEINKTPNFTTTSYSIVIKDTSGNTLYSLVNTGNLPTQINISPIYLSPLLVNLSYSYSGNIYTCNKILDNILNFSCKFYFEQRKIYRDTTSSCDDEGCDYFIIAPNSAILPILIDNTLSYSYSINLSPASHCIDSNCNTNHSDQFYLGDLCKTITLDNNVNYDITSTINIVEANYSQTCNVSFKKPRINFRYYSYLNPKKRESNYIQLNVLDLNFTPLTYSINYTIDAVNSVLTPLTIPYTYTVGTGNSILFKLEIYSAPLSNLLNYDFDNRHYYYYHEEWGFDINDIDFEISLLDCFSGIKVKFNNIDFTAHSVTVMVLEDDLIIATQSSSSVNTLPEIPVNISNFENYETLFIKFVVYDKTEGVEVIDCSQVHYNKVYHILEVPKFEITNCVTDGNETIIEMEYNSAFDKLVEGLIDITVKDQSNNILFQQFDFGLGRVSITPPIFANNIIVEIKKSSTYLGDINCVFNVENNIENATFQIEQIYKTCNETVNIYVDLVSGPYITYVCEIELLDASDNLITSVSINSLNGYFSYDLSLSGLGIVENEFYKSKVTIKNMYGYTITTDEYKFYYFRTSIYYDTNTNSIMMVGGAPITQTDIEIINVANNAVVYSVTDINGMYSIAYQISSNGTYEVYLLSEVLGLHDLVHECRYRITINP